MKFQLVIQRIRDDKSRFGLYLENMSTSDARVGRCLVATGSSMHFLKGKSTTIFNIVLQWCDGDDPDYDSTEYFEI